MTSGNEGGTGTGRETLNGTRPEIQNGSGSAGTNAVPAPILRADIPAWNAWRQRNPQSGVDLREADLQHLDLSDSNLGDAVLAGANLRGAILVNADLRRSNLDGADLRGANLTGAKLAHATLRGADLRQATLDGADLYFAKLGDAQLERASACRAFLNLAELRRANLSLTVLKGATLNGANVAGVHWDRTDLTDADLANAHEDGIPFDPRTWVAPAEAPQRPTSGSR